MEKGGGQLVDAPSFAPSFVDLCTLHSYAMRYYRLWIYACNIVLALATLIFAVTAISIFVDPRILLLSDVTWYHPTFIYAYVVLTFQCGFLQAIGCVGALRLNQKLLTIYWNILLALVIGDIFAGLVWAIKLDQIKSNFKPDLKLRLQSQYINDTHFTKVWDFIQSNDVCCGVDGPLDFLQFNDSSSSNFDSNGLPLDMYSGFHHPKLPSSCCIFTISNYAPPTPLSSPSPKSPQHIRTNRVNYSHHYANANNNFTYNRSNNAHLSSFGTGTGTHNRRKILHGARKHEPDPSQNPHPHRHNVQTTTESSRRFTQFGVCALPPKLVAKYKNNIYVKVSDTIIDSYSFFEGSGGGNGRFSSEESPGSQSTEHPWSSSTTSTSSVLESTWSSGDSISTTPTTSFPLSSTATYPNHNSSPSSPYVLVSMTLNNDPCGDKVLDWVDHASDVLFVIGFCIIVFLKGCFLAILRYEIKEMIQKIKLLNGEDDGRQAAMNELIGLTSLYRDNEDDTGERDGLMASSGSEHRVIEPIANTNIDAIESDKRKDSVISRDHHNCHMGNHHVGNHNRNKAPLGNHVAVEIGPGGSSASTTPSTTTVMMGSSRGRQGGDADNEGKLSETEKNCKDEPAGRSFPRNGNNNNTNTTGLGGVTGSASAPIPIESMAKA